MMELTHWLKNPKGHVKDLGIDGKVMLKLFLKKRCEGWTLSGKFNQNFVAIECEIFMDNYATVSFSRRTLLREVLCKLRTVTCRSRRIGVIVADCTQSGVKVFGFVFWSDRWRLDSLYQVLVQWIALKYYSEEIISVTG
jgi:hypothetical protein